MGSPAIGSDCVGAVRPGCGIVSPTGGGVLVDHVVGLFEAWVSYDFHGCAFWKGCGPDCPDGELAFWRRITADIRWSRARREWLDERPTRR